MISSGGFTAAYNILAPRFEQKTDKRIISAYGASMGNAPMPFPSASRAASRPTSSFSRPALDEFAARGVVRPDSRVDLAESQIGVTVRAGAPKPNIATVEALRRTLLAASSIASSASGAGFMSRPSATSGSASRQRRRRRAAASE
ncbi:substrate-binding domain-containing protein [Microvirga massiliensis]|uniref:substrate-binding domain-containing protein n=1 Tax=Microvirga massiliensis TaxID=1033741 RepID=UPI000A94B41B|nr:substrate-binding domain-containing protein [Microvirga massiliensis]